MKKYFISKFYIVTYIIALVIFPVPMAIMSLYAIIKLNSLFSGCLVLAICVCLFFSLVYMLLLDFPTGTVEFSDWGIRQRIGRNTVDFSWSDFCEYRIIRTPINQFGDSLYWVCCSTKYLSPTEQQNFLRKTRRKRESIAYFQYSHKAFDEFITYMDEETGERLRDEGSNMIANMRLLEKLYNR